MPKPSRKKIFADDIAGLADQAKDISPHFTGHFTLIRPSIQRVNVDFTAPMLKELDREAESLDISRQAVIKTMLREALDRCHVAQHASEL